MSQRPKNEPIGDCECPHKGCAVRAPVFKFRQRGEGRAIFAGKLYLICETHGRFGGDGKPATQEYFLENATIWGDGKKPANPGNQTAEKNGSVPDLAGPLPAKSLPPAPSVQAEPPEPALPAKSRNWLESWMPVIK